MVKNNRAITPSEAIAAFERAFRSRNPNEVERLLRDMLNVQVAVVNSKQEAEELLAKGKRLKTVPVPYGVFLGKVREIFAEGRQNQSSRESDTGLYLLKLNDKSFRYTLLPIFSVEGILPGKTYVLLSDLAGYSPKEGLTFSGSGCSTGFEDYPKTEQREKFTEGRFQTWQEHSKGVWERSERTAQIYRPFVQSWAEHVLSEQWKELSDKKDEFVESLLWAMRVSVLMHDVGKLNKRWQEVAWKNEQIIRDECIDWQQYGQFIARTSNIPNDDVRKQIVKPPPHAPFAYPFLRTFLRKLLGDYRFCDAIALAAARHHSLEVTGAIREGDFDLTENAYATIECLLKESLKELSDSEREILRSALSEALKAIKQSTEADEPPSPSDDFYLIYCLANRMVKVCDWEDAGQSTVELPSVMEG